MVASVHAKTAYSVDQGPLLHEAGGLNPIKVSDHQAQLLPLARRVTLRQVEICHLVLYDECPFSMASPYLLVPANAYPAFIARAGEPMHIVSIQGSPILARWNKVAKPSDVIPSKL